MLSRPIAVSPIGDELCARLCAHNVGNLRGGRTILHEFIIENRAEIVARCRAKISSRPAPRPTDVELEHGVPLFLDQLADTLRLVLTRNPAIGESAIKHGAELLNGGFTIAQVVHDYGGICQSITELATETGAPITTSEFQTLNLCLDDAIAEAVTKYSTLREHAGTERLGRVAHELRNLLNSALLAFDILRTGKVGLRGSTCGVLERSLSGLRNVIDRELAVVRLAAGLHHREVISLRSFMEDVEVAASMEATARGLQLSAAASVASDVEVFADRQILGSVVGNLIQNAFKFTAAHGHIWVRARATPARVFIDVEDQCGGLAPSIAEKVFHPVAFTEQLAADRTGLGLGLSICYRGAKASDGEIHVVDHPGVGCVFTLDLPRHPGIAIDASSKPAASS